MFTYGEGEEVEYIKSHTCKNKPSYVSIDLRATSTNKFWVLTLEYMGMKGLLFYY